MFRNMSAKLLLASLAVAALSGPAFGRGIQNWTYEKLMDGSDLIVIAKPIASVDIEEKEFPGFPFLPNFPTDTVVGVETTFEVQGVLKGEGERQEGEKRLKLTKIVLHHYRLNGRTPPNGPNLVAFDPQQPKTYLLFLKKAPDTGRYVPVNGQADPAMYSVIELKRPLE